MASTSTTGYKSSKESTAIGLTSNFYLNKYYGTNHDITKSSRRKDFANCELVYEDSKALHKASKYLSRNKYSDGAIEENIYSSIIAFKDTYNNAIDSTKGLDNDEAKKYLKKLKGLIKDNEEAFEDIGITIDSKTQKLEVNENILKASKMDDIKKLFSSDNKLLKKTASISKRINTIANEYIYAKMTGSGLKINITL